MLTVSPNRVSTYRRCPSAGGYSYVLGDKRKVRLPGVRRGVNRGQAIHGAVLGEGPDERATDERERNRDETGPLRNTDSHRLNLSPEQWKTPGPGEHYDPVLADADARLIWAVIDMLWPGYRWRKEETLYTQLTPGIRLDGRLDLWGQGPDGAFDILDLKTSTAFTTTALDGFSDALDHQLILYARLVRDNLAAGTITGKPMPGVPLPRIWRLGFNPATKRPHRRRFPLSDELIEQASRYAVHVACSLERMQAEHPLEWLRSMACEHPLPCPYKPVCARDTGAWYTDGRTPSPETSSGSVAAGQSPALAQSYEAPIPVTSLVRGPLNRTKP